MPCYTTCSPMSLQAQVSLNKFHKINHLSKAEYLNKKRGNSRKTMFSNSCMNKGYGSGKIIRKRGKAESLFLHEKFRIDLLYNPTKYH